MRVADFRLSSLNSSLEDSSALPISLLDFVHEVLQTTYPPEPRNKIVSLWALRSLQTAVNNCPPKLITRMLEILHDGISLWLNDECDIFSKDEYSRDVRILTICSIHKYLIRIIGCSSLPDDSGYSSNPAAIWSYPSGAVGPPTICSAEFRQLGSCGILPGVLANQLLDSSRAAGRLGRQSEDCTLHCQLQR